MNVCFREAARTEGAVRFADLQHLPDAELVELTLGGEEAAFNAMMKRYNQRLFRAARAIVRDDRIATLSFNARPCPLQAGSSHGRHHRVPRPTSRTPIR